MDVDGNGISLTSAESGVYFRPDDGPSYIRTAWTAAGSDDAFLVLDRNGNGIVDNGTERFGAATPQPVPPAGSIKNGFLALTVFDQASAGGNQDGIIDAQDVIFSELRLWQDVNHDGVSQPSELKSLNELGISGIALTYKEAKKTDQFGNLFKFRAKVWGNQDSHPGRWAWDFFPQVISQ